jgi:hypothetical protein
LEGDYSDLEQTIQPKINELELERRAAGFNTSLEPA